MSRTPLLILPIVALGVAGYKGFSPQEPKTGSAVQAAQAFTLEGTWRSQFVDETPKGKDGEADMATAVAKMMAGVMSMKIKFSSGNLFKLYMMGIPFVGHYSEKGNILHLVPETVLGKTPAEWKKLQAKGAAEAKDAVLPFAEVQPLDAQVDRAKGIIVLLEPGQKSVDTSNKVAMVFKKVDSIDETKLPITVKPEEKELVGDWHGKADFPKPEKEEKEKASAEQMAMVQDLMKSINLDLRQDNTFLLEMFFDMEGKWSREGNVITLTPTKLMDFDLKDADEKSSDPKKKKEEPIVLTLSADGKTLSGKGEKDGPTFSFSRQ